MGAKTDRVVTVSRDELEAQRAKVLARVGMSLDELEGRAEDGALVGAEWDAWQELRDIAFLLGDG